ncbi:MAG: antibiotic biosynthesis monooxygenase [Bacteroidetes bacterium]|nr:antibiotic biosynthesis monooxygenase [Bacteroidota bacterium]
MIIRIVKMTFEEDKVGDFLKIFHESASQIRNFPGCNHLELYRDHMQSNVLFTYSFWESKSNLENYRKSELFLSTWAKTKALFAAKAEAWSVSRIWNG